MDGASIIEKGLARILALGMVSLVCACSEQENTVELCTGEYPFAQIDEWFHRLSPQIMSIPGVHTADADERYNCVMVGIEHADVKSEVRSKATEVDVPTDAVGFHVSDPFVALDVSP